MPPKRIKECEKGTRRERERKGKEEKRGQKERERLKHSQWQETVRQQQTGEGLGRFTSTYLSQGHTSPQHLPTSFKLFSASIMSLLIWFMPSSTRSSCSGQDKGVTAMKWDFSSWQTNDDDKWHLSCPETHLLKTWDIWMMRWVVRLGRVEKMVYEA